MQVFINIPGQRLATYNTKTDNDTILNIKRFIAETCKLEDRHKIYDMGMYYKWKCLENHDKVIDVLENEATIFVTYKIYSGPVVVPCEFSQVIAECGSNEFQKVNVSYGPSHTILYIIQQVLEYLVSMNKLNCDLTVNDVYLKLGNQVLDPKKYTAEYPELATSFITFNSQDDFVNRLSTVGLLIDKFGSYYQIIHLGERLYTNKKLEFFVGQPERNIEDAEDDIYGCSNCHQKYDIIVPCCRKRSCFNCFENNVRTIGTCCYCNRCL